MVQRSVQPFLFIGGFDSSAFCRSRRELSDAYLLAKTNWIQPRTIPLKLGPHARLGRDAAPRGDRHPLPQRLLRRRARGPRRRAPVYDGTTTCNRGGQNGDLMNLVSTFGMISESCKKGNRSKFENIVKTPWTVSTFPNTSTSHCNIDLRCAN